VLRNLLLFCQSMDQKRLTATALLSSVFFIIYVNTVSQINDQNQAMSVGFRQNSIPKSNSYCDACIFISDCMSSLSRIQTFMLVCLFFC
jgi:hypothetical protein